MGIRVATLDDLPRILVLGEKMHKESPRWARLAFSRARAADFMAQLILRADGVVFLAEREGVIIGGIAGAAAPHWSGDDVVAQEIALFVDPDARGAMAATRLICALKAWAGMRNAKFLLAGTSTGIDPERTAGLYERLGFSRCVIGLEVTY